MKKAIITLSILLIIVGIYAYNRGSKVNELQSELSSQKELFDIRLKTEITREESRVTDSLTEQYENREPITITKTKIQVKYEKVTDTVYLLPSSEQLEYVTNELDRLYDNK
jgi:predicted Holliday junction resolvase-like endonuclease